MIRRLLALAAALFSLAAKADDISLVRVGDPWRYLVGLSEASDPIEAWRGLAFEDASWSIGRSGFSTTGEEMTSLSGSAPFTSVFFRRTFTVTDPATVRWLILRADYDDGFVAYLNGTEIVRRGLAGDPVPFDAWADFHPRGIAEEFDVSGYATLLRPGTNVLAIQLHAAATARSLVLVPELLANFQRGPLIMNLSTGSVQIVWRTPQLSDSTVRFGPDETLSSEVSDTNSTATHALTLADLQPGQRYFYRVSSSTEGLAAQSPVFSFVTLKATGSVTFAVAADMGLGNPPHLAVAERMRQDQPEFILNAGDVIYPYFQLGFADTRLFSVSGEQMRSTAIFPSPGNHDLYGGDGAYLASFYLPTNSVTGTEHYYSFDAGDVHFVCLFVPLFSQLPQYILEGPSESAPEGSQQYQWLTNDLARTSKRWKVLVFHSPLATSAAHRFDDYNYNGLPDHQDLQGILHPVVQRYGVQLAFNGHDHDFERFAPTNGLYSIVTGGAGNPLYSISERDVSSLQFWRAYHYTKVTIAGDMAHLQAIQSDGTVLDEFRFHIAAPPRQLWPAAWHSPLVEARPGDDGDANHTGQQFDFRGAAIPSRTGAFSNPGELLVNIDGQNLYLGLRHVALQADNNLFVFLQVPGLPGVAELRDLGNGIVDPAFEGADGLDFLENLSFTNFSPAIVCVLGDEWADGQFRAFTRPRLQLDVGQGVFFLDPSFTEIPGVRLQQYNKSPQQYYPGMHQGVFQEQNADFIEVSIPLSALGNVQAGDVIKLGAVVGGPGFDPNPSVQSRELDSGFLGVNLHGQGQGPVLLEGLEVRIPEIDLAGDPDGDGLETGWELAHQLDWLSALGVHGADGDPDQDGFLNANEHAAGTDPQDARSALRVQVRWVAPDQFQFTWQTVAGKTYELAYASNVPGEFVPWPDPTFPRLAGGAEQKFLLDLRGQVKPDLGFFRIRIVP